MKKSRRKCKHCKEWYEPKFKTTEPCPKYECREKQLTILTPKINRVNKANAKERLKTLSDYEAEAKKEFQKFIRIKTYHAHAAELLKQKSGTGRIFTQQIFIVVLFSMKETYTNVAITAMFIYMGIY